MHFGKKNKFKLTAVALCTFMLVLFVVFLLRRFDVFAGGNTSSQGDGDAPEQLLQVMPDPSVSEAAPAEPDTPARIPIRPLYGGLELPVEGATGYLIINASLYAAPEDAQPLYELPAGSCFAIRREENEWLYVEGDGRAGWLLSEFCMVNLPDVIPSIVYDAINTYSARFTSCGQAIPGITGEALYEARTFNPRLGTDEFVMPVLYSTAKRLCAAQQAALAEGNTLVLYEAYRPHTTQCQVATELTAFANEHEEIYQELNSGLWEMDWFIASGLSNHQKGYAVDVGLARVDAFTEQHSGAYPFTQVQSYTLYEMQTPIHELSPASAALLAPLSPASPNWCYAEPASGMTSNAFLLQQYCTDAGLLPLASEWWHFNDFTALTDEINTKARGEFFTDQCLSTPPETP